MPDLPEVYRSECCGVLVTPGSRDYDDIHEAQEGNSLVVREEREGRNSYSGRVYDISRDTAEQFDAVRGECPACGAAFPGLVLLIEAEGGIRA